MVVAGAGAEVSKGQTPCSAVPHFHPQGQVSKPSTRILLYFRRLWEVGELSFLEELRLLVILPFPLPPSGQLPLPPGSYPSLQAATLPSSLPVTEFPLFSPLR